ncbi:hypothetical protein Tco_1468112 [Tanacetum coccineum]
MTTPITTNATDSQMHNNIIEAGLRVCPPMLVMGRYARWQSRFMRYVDTKPKGEALKICILQGPYKLSNLIIPEAEAIHLILTRIGDDIYLTVDAYKTTHDMWIAIERFTLRDGESIESYYSRNANPLAFVAAAQQYPNTYYQTPKPKKSYKPPSKQSYSTRYHASTRHKGKEIAKPITTLSESASEEDSDLKQAQRDKEIQKNLALIANEVNRDPTIGIRANLTLDTEENNQIQKQYKKANALLAQELKECKSNLEEANRTLRESNRTRDRYLGALHDKEVELAKYKTYKDRTIENDTLECKLKETLGLLA